MNWQPYHDVFFSQKSHFNLLDRSWKRTNRSLGHLDKTTWRHINWSLGSFITCPNWASIGQNSAITQGQHHELMGISFKSPSVQPGTVNTRAPLHILHIIKCHQSAAFYTIFCDGVRSLRLHPPPAEWDNLIHVGSSNFLGLPETQVSSWHALREEFSLMHCWPE